MNNCSNTEMMKTSSELPGKYWCLSEYSDIDDDNNDINMNISTSLVTEEIRVIIVEREK